MATEKELSELIGRAVTDLAPYLTMTSLNSKIQITIHLMSGSTP
jgi:hypothetical protein